MRILSDTCPLFVTKTLKCNIYIDRKHPEVHLHWQKSTGADPDRPKSDRPVNRHWPELARHWPQADFYWSTLTWINRHTHFIDWKWLETESNLSRPWLNKSDWPLNPDQQGSLSKATQASLDWLKATQPASMDETEHWPRLMETNTFQLYSTNKFKHISLQELWVLGFGTNIHIWYTELSPQVHLFKHNLISLSTSRYIFSNKYIHVSLS